MNLLALETSSDLFSVALKVDQRGLKYDEFITYQSSQKILPIVQQLLLEGGVKLKELDAFVLGIGPGSFTGLRLAGSVVQAFSFACGLPVILISSLRAAAQAAFESLQSQKILVAMNAYQEEVYWAGYELDEVGLMQTVIPDSLAAPHQVLVPNSLGWIGVGNAWKLYENPLKNHCSKQLSDIQIEHYPTASALITLGEAAFLQGKGVSAAEAIPVYLRGQEAWKRQL